MGTLSFLQADRVPVLSSVDTDDHVLLVNEAGAFRRATSDAVLRSVLSVKMVSWDLAASYAAVAIEPLAFNQFFRLAVDPSLTTSVPSVNTSTDVITKLAPADGGKDRAIWSLRGMVPVTGTHWIALNADCNSSATTHRIYIGSEVIPDLANSSNCLGMIEIKGTSIKSVRFADGAESVLNLSQTTQKVMLQINASQVTVYATANYSFSFGARGVGALRIGGEIASTSAGSVTLGVNTTDVNTAPRTPDSGYTALSMVDSVLPAGSNIGDVLYPRTGGVYRDQLLVPRTRYFNGADYCLTALLDDSSTALLSRENMFEFAIGFNGNYKLQASASDSSCLLGPATSAMHIALQQDRLTNVYSLGANCPAMGTGSYSHLYLFGQTFANLTTPRFNVAIGQAAAAATDTSNYNVLIGPRVAQSLTRVNNSVIVGDSAADILGFNMSKVVAIGHHALSDHSDDSTFTPVNDNIAIGAYSQSGGDLGNENVAIGSDSLRTAEVVTGNSISGNTAVGHMSMEGRVGPQSFSVAVGHSALRNATEGEYNVAVGYSAANGLEGSHNVAIGDNALTGSAGEMLRNTAVGTNSMTGLTAVENSTAIGYNATVTGSNQVQLGNSNTTTYTYGAVQSRSDERDKTDIEDSPLGLDFILSLRPVRFRYDYREDYLDMSLKPVCPASLGPEPTVPTLAKDHPDYERAFNAYLTAAALYQEAQIAHVQAMRIYESQLANWDEYVRLGSIVRTGKHKHRRFHFGFLAGDVKKAADKARVDFGGYQNHSLNGGSYIESLGYEEFVAPLTLAIQQLDKKIASDTVVDAVVDRLIDRLANSPDHPLIDILAAKMLEKMQSTSGH